VWAAPPAQPIGAVPPARSSTATWLAGIALAVAALALVLAGIALAVALAGTGAGPAGDMAFGDLHGEVVGTPAGERVSGARIEEAVTTLLLSDGAEVDEVICPDLLSLQPGSSVVCTGTVDGDHAWQGRVAFTGTNGEFDLREW
jgi:hypothetical protein